VGDERQFGPVKMVWMGVVGAEEMKKGVGQGHYHPGQIARNNKYLYKKGTEVYLIDMGDGKVLIMQSWTNSNKGGQGQPQELGSQFELPPGWKFRLRCSTDLTVSPPAPESPGWVTMDEFQTSTRLRLRRRL
jgi:hypothetical protein